MITQAGGPLVWLDGERAQRSLTQLRGLIPIMPTDIADQVRTELDNRTIYAGESEDGDRRWWAGQTIHLTLQRRTGALDAGIGGELVEIPTSSIDD